MHSSMLNTISWASFPSRQFSVRFYSFYFKNDTFPINWGFSADNLISQFHDLPKSYCLLFTKYSFFISLPFFYWEFFALSSPNFFSRIISRTTNFLNAEHSSPKRSLTANDFVLSLWPIKNVQFLVQGPNFPICFNENQFSERRPFPFNTFPC